MAKTKSISIRKEINQYGDVYYYNEQNQLHREDGPAVEYVNGNKCWHQNGKCHRKDGPAIEHVDGTKVWYQNGKCHRVDGPAIEYANGGKVWWYNNKLISKSFDGYTQEKFERWIKLKSFV